MTLVGDEHGRAEWSRGVSGIFDGDTWYWSDENPYTNPHVFTTLAALATELRSQGKLWFSPLIAGYNKSNFGVGGTCVPRNDGQTLRTIYAGNARSDPDGWMFISWNEYFENTYLEPSALYGNRYLAELAQLRG